MRIIEIPPAKVKLPRQWWGLIYGAAIIAAALVIALALQMFGVIG